MAVNAYALYIHCRMTVSNYVYILNMIIETCTHTDGRTCIALKQMLIACHC